MDAPSGTSFRLRKKEDPADKLEQRRAAQVGLPAAPASIPGSGSWAWCLGPKQKRLDNMDLDAGHTAHHMSLHQKSLSTGTLKIHETRREAERVLGATYHTEGPPTPGSETSSQGARRRITEIQEARFVPATCNQMYGALHHAAEPVVVKHRKNTCDECLFVDALTKTGRLHCPEIRFGGVG